MAKLLIINSWYAIIVDGLENISFSNSMWWKEILITCLHLTGLRIIKLFFLSLAIVILLLIYTQPATWLVLLLAKNMFMYPTEPFITKHSNGFLHKRIKTFPSNS